MKLQQLERLRHQTFCDEAAGPLDWSIHRKCLQEGGKAEATA